MWGTERLRAGVFIASLVGLPFAQAQTPTITDADIERARRAQPTVTEADIQRARERHRAPTDAELRQAPAPSAPRIDALPQPASRAPIDLEALARGFGNGEGARMPKTQSGPALLVFVSFAMPEAALSRLLDQAERARASLVLRGLVDASLVRTVARVQQLIGSRRVAVQIDPQAFDRYAITQTPSFVLVHDGATAAPCANGLCIPADGYVMAAGDVTLDYALAFIQRSAPAFSKDADAFLKRLKAPAG
ncbi:MAG: type-F conjugative transfer system pilin assembly protein TrbC [Rubrivivax sp.]|nr:type-F conjugative transfer system pilin assembly protein TrbC [Rubrivivax sp.]